MHTFTIDGVTYLPHDNSLFIVQEEVTEIETLEENQFYLHEGNVGTFELPPDYMAFDAIFNPNTSNHSLHYTIENTGNLGDDFTSARPLDRLVPDQLEECPNCGAAAGDKDEDHTPNCFQCGYGTEDGLFEEREEQTV